jgi:hypothetical protein
MKGDEDNKNIYFSIPHISVIHIFLFFCCICTHPFCLLVFHFRHWNCCTNFWTFLVVEQSNSLIVRHLLEKVTDCTDFTLPAVGTDCIVSWIKYLPYSLWYFVFLFVSKSVTLFLACSMYSIMWTFELLSLNNVQLICLFLHCSQCC